MEKDLLRRAFRGWIPDEILWRTKEEFGDGSGVSGMKAAYRRHRRAPDFAIERSRHDPPLRTREEVAYHRIWWSALAPTRPEVTLSRFATA